MEAIAAVIGLIATLLVAGTLFFLCFVQPIWSIVDIANSRTLSTGSKTVLIVLTFVLLGPLLTFFYALFGTESRTLRQLTVGGTATLVLAIAGMIGLAALSTVERSDLPGAGTAGVTRDVKAEAQAEAGAGAGDTGAVDIAAVDVNPD